MQAYFKQQLKFIKYTGILIIIYHYKTAVKKITGKLVS